MFYVYSHKVTTGDTVTNPKRIDIKLAQGVIHQVDILFQDGCNHLVGVQIWRGEQQLWPSNRGYAFTGNATVISFREFEEITKGKDELYALIWGDGSISGVEVVVQLGLLAKEVLQPLSWSELIALAAGSFE
jgi:hypothetical protein